MVAKYVGLAGAAGLDWEVVQGWSEQQLGTALLPRLTASQVVVVPDWGRLHRELDRKGMTLMLLWQECMAMRSTGAPGRSCSSTSRAPRCRCATVPEGASLRLGDGGIELRLRLRHDRPAPGRLGGGEVRALHFYGGVPQPIVPDNASAVIASPDRYEPRANETVQDLARHYGT